MQPSIKIVGPGGDAVFVIIPPVEGDGRMTKANQ